MYKSTRASKTLFQNWEKLRLKECGLTNLDTRRLIGDQIDAFNILNGHEMGRNWND